MFSSEHIEFPAPDDPASARALEAVIALATIGILLLAVLAMLSAGMRAGHVPHQIVTAAPTHLIGHVRLRR